MAKKSRRNNATYRKNRKNRKNTRRNNMRRMMYGGYESAPGAVNGNAMAQMMKQSLAQGQQFDKIHANQHGGALEAGPFPGAIVAPTILPEDLRASARVLPLDGAYNEIKNLGDQFGGRRRNRKGRKASKKSRKAKRKGSRKTRRMYYGGSYDLANAASVNAPGLLLSPAMEQKALTGMNAEWKLAENPMAFAPGYAEKA